MKNNTSSKTNPLVTFFLLTFIFTLPAYILIGLASKSIILSPEMAFSFVPLSAFAPIGAALLLTFKENGRNGVKKLFGRAFDHKRITRKIWYLPIFFLPPFLVILALGVTILLGLPLVDALFPVWAAPLVFLLFFGGALGEEVGWMGYAFEPMQERWHTFKAALLLGLIWALWHVPMYVFLIDDPAMLTAQLLFPLAIRILIVWIFNNTGKSLFAAILFHTMYNVAYGVFATNTVVATLFAIITAVVVTFLWGSKSMAKFRWKELTN